MVMNGYGCSGYMGVFVFISISKRVLFHIDLEKRVKGKYTCTASNCSFYRELNHLQHLNQALLSHPALICYEAS